ncbi:MAG: PAS domain S-box protein [Candidatus Lokiarchaeota archaeon]|nr:PAS domain S-box protein [Candidatus Lokiarchaeota archaeon]
MKINQDFNNQSFNQRFRLILDSLNDPTHIVNKDLVIILVNPAFYNLVEKYNLKGEIIGRNIKEIFTFLPDKIIEEYNHVLKTGETLQTDEELIINGEKLYTEVIKIPIYHKEEVLQIITIIKDVTERKTNKEKLYETEKKFKQLLESSTDFIIITNKDGIMEYLNRTRPEFKLNQMIGTSVYDFIPNDYVQNFKESVEKVFQSGEMQKFIMKEQVIEDKFKWYEDHLIPLKKGEKVTSLMIVAKEITDLKEAEEKVKESEEKYRILIEGIQDGVFLIQDQKMIFINDAFAKIVGYNAGEIIGTNFQDLIAPEDLEMVTNRYYRRQLGEHVPKEYEFKMLHKDGTTRIIVNMNVGIVSYKNKLTSLGTVKNITESKKAQDKIKESEAKFKEAFNRTQFYKDVFAHDINNILQTILTSSELALINLNDPNQIGEVKNLLVMIKEQILRGSNLISNVQKLSTLEEAKIQLKIIEVFGFLKNSIRHTIEGFKEKVVITQIDSHYEKLHVLANDLLMDVFENILFNAVKYNDNETIEILIRIFKEQKINRNYIKMEFIDNGRGIEEERREFVFLRGNYEKKSIGGMGLGLSLVKKIIESYEGQIWIEDRIKGDYKKGTKFIILIPEGHSN